MKMMKVKATQHRVPREDNHLRYIESEPFEVPATSMYYHRRIADGELVIVADDEKKGA